MSLVISQDLIQQQPQSKSQKNIDQVKQYQKQNQQEPKIYQNNIFGQPKQQIIQQVKAITNSNSNDKIHPQMEQPECSIFKILQNNQENQEPQINSQQAQATLKLRNFCSIQHTLEQAIIKSISDIVKLSLASSEIQFEGKQKSDKDDNIIKQDATVQIKYAQTMSQHDLDSLIQSKSKQEESSQSLIQSVQQNKISELKNINANKGQVNHQINRVQCASFTNQKNKQQNNQKFNNQLKENIEYKQFFSPPTLVSIKIQPKINQLTYSLQYDHKTKQNNEEKQHNIQTNQTQVAAFNTQIEKIQQPKQQKCPTLQEGNKLNQNKRQNGNKLQDRYQQKEKIPANNLIDSVYINQIQQALDPKSNYKIMQQTIYPVSLVYQQLLNRKPSVKYQLGQKYYTNNPNQINNNKYTQNQLINSNNSLLLEEKINQHPKQEFINQQNHEKNKDNNKITEMQMTKTVYSVLIQHSPRPFSKQCSHVEHLQNQSNATSLSKKLGRKISFTYSSPSVKNQINQNSYYTPNNFKSGQKNASNHISFHKLQNSQFSSFPSTNFKNQRMKKYEQIRLQSLTKQDNKNSINFKVGKSNRRSISDVNQMKFVPEKWNTRLNQQIKQYNKQIQEFHQIKVTQKNQTIEDKLHQSGSKIIKIDKLIHKSQSNESNLSIKKNKSQSQPKNKQQFYVVNQIQDMNSVSRQTRKQPKSISRNTKINLVTNKIQKLDNISAAISGFDKFKQNHKNEMTISLKEIQTHVIQKQVIKNVSNPQNAPECKFNIPWSECCQNLFQSQLKHENKQPKLASQFENIQSVIIEKQNNKAPNTASTLHSRQLTNYNNQLSRQTYLNSRNPHTAKIRFTYSNPNYIQQSYVRQFSQNDKIFYQPTDPRQKQKINQKQLYTKNKEIIQNTNRSINSQQKNFK